jgi:thiamine-phosphate pyrophosphorylase
LQGAAVISGGFWTLRRTAALLKPPAGGRKALPSLLALTDPQRTRDLEALAASLPRGAALVFRAFGAPDAETTARRLRTICRTRGVKLLIGVDWALAAQVGADGVHLPERLAAKAGALKAARPGWIVTAAAHSAAAARRGLNGADAVVVSPAFASNSPSAGAPLGPLRLAGLARVAGGPVYALGGVNDRTAARLRGLGLVGLAAVEGLAP